MARGISAVALLALAGCAASNPPATVYVTAPVVQTREGAVTWEKKTEPPALRKVIEINSTVQELRGRLGEQPFR